MREALAGLAVIVVGVLLALASDAAWADRGDRIREQELLTDLLEEFEENASILAADIAQNDRAIEAGAAWSQAVLGEVVIPYDSVQSLLLVAMDDARFDPVTGALRSVVDGGELGLIRNMHLRRALAGWGDRAMEARLTSESWDRVRTNLLPLVLSYDPDAPVSPQRRTAVGLLTSTFARQNSQMNNLAPRIREIATMIQGEIKP